MLEDNSSKRLEEEESESVAALLPVPKEEFLNYGYLVEMAPDDKDFRKEMVHIYRETFRQMQEDYPKALLSKDHTQLRSIHHKIKPTVTMLDIAALRQLIEKTESLIREDALNETLEAHALQVITTCDTIIEVLQEALRRDLDGN